MVHAFTTQINLILFKQSISKLRLFPFFVPEKWSWKQHPEIRQPNYPASYSIVIIDYYYNFTYN